MKQKKKLKELTIKDNFMFGAVMTDEENCRKLLELVLGFAIGQVTVSKEKSIVYHPEYKGVRLDIYAKDDKKTHYNVEMQVVQKPELEKRTRYYHSQIDMELLLSGQEYTELPDAYVIFICDFDPFEKEKYRYTFVSRCMEEKSLTLNKGCQSIFLSTCGKNAKEIPAALVKFLEFVKADLTESEENFEDEFANQLQKCICSVKKSREMEERFMILEEMLRDERAEGKAEGAAGLIIEMLQDLGKVPDDLRERIMEETDLEILKKWNKSAVRADSVEAFQKEM